MYVSVLRWFQSTCCKFIHCDVTTGADTMHDKDVNRYQQQQQQFMQIKHVAPRCHVTIDFEMPNPTCSHYIL